MKRAPAFYSVGRTYHRTKSLLFDQHLSRLEDSAGQLGFSLDCDPIRLRAALRQMILESDYGDVRFRISVAADAPGETLLSIEPFQPPSPQLIERGARCITSSERRHKPASKSSAWMHRRRVLEAGQPADIYETFLRDPQGQPAGRRFQQRLCHSGWRAPHCGRRRAGGHLADDRPRRLRARSPLHPAAPTLPTSAVSAKHSYRAAAGASSRWWKLDGMPIGNGRVGAVTLALRSAYQRWVDDHLEEL